MALPYSYSDLFKRFTDARSWAGEITEGNRCALVMGITLNLKPDRDQLNFRGQKSANSSVRNQPFLEKMFVKAEDLVSQITRTYGPPDVEVCGLHALDAVARAPGVIFLRDCWSTPTEKVTFSKNKSGDHIDLWDGSIIEIYRSHANANSLVLNARNVLLWRSATQ